MELLSDSDVGSRDTLRRPKDYKISFKGSPRNREPLSEILNSSGKRYKTSTQGQIAYLVANEVRKREIDGMKTKLYEFLKQVDPTKECLILALHENPNKFSIHLELNSENRLQEFLENPRVVIFPKTTKLVAGVRACLENALNLDYSAHILLNNERTDHAAFLLITAFEEIGKALMLVDSGRKAIEEHCESAMVEKWRDHEAKIRESMDLLLGKTVKIEPNAYRREKGALDSLRDTLSEIDFEDMKACAGFSGVSLFMTLENLTRIHREYALFVEHDGIDIDWQSPKIQFNGDVLSLMCNLAAAICKILLHEFEKIKTIAEVPDLKELLRDKLSEKFPDGLGLLY